MRRTQAMRRAFAVMLVIASAGLARANLVFEQVSTFGDGLGKPVRIAATSNGWAVSYPRENTAVIFDAAGNKLRDITGLKTPLAIAFLSPDNLFIGEQNPGRVSVWKTGDGTLIRSFGTDLVKPSDILIVSSKVYVLDSSARIVKVYDMTGNALPSIGGPSYFTQPAGLSYDSRRGLLQVSELMSGTIHVFDLSGRWKYDIGELGTLEGEFVRVDGIGYTDLDLHLGVDPFLSVIEAVEPNGKYRGEGGSFGTDPGQLKTPLGLAIGSGQKVAVANFGNDRVELFKMSFDSAADTLTVPDGVFVNLTGPVVTAGTQDFGSTIYIERPDRASGMRVDNVTTATARGAVVAVSGNTATEGGQRKIVASSVTAKGTAVVPPALGVRGTDLGGTSPSPATLSIPGTTGLYNVGLLVKVWGRVKSVSGGDFYISDGSARDTWVHTSGISPLPKVNDFVSVIGVCSVANDTGGALRARVIPRNASDIKGL